METSTLESLAVAAEAPPPPAQPSPWLSPVPYLFGVLSVVVGLIAFVILILASSYWKLTGYLDNQERDVEAAGGGEKSTALPPELEEKYLVIMAGQEKPSFLATPAMWIRREVVFNNYGENSKPPVKFCGRKVEMGCLEAHVGALSRAH